MEEFMFNGAQMHLALNHMPVVGVMMGLLVLLSGYGLKQLLVKRTGLALILFAALTALPAYFSGEPAEEIVEHKPGVAKHDIHEHEESAEVALVFSLIGGAIAGGALIAGLKKRGIESKATAAAGLVSLVTAALMVNTAHLGGMIRHDELRPAGAASAVSTEAVGESGEHGDGDHDD